MAAKSKIVLIKPENDVVTEATPLGLLHVGTLLDQEGFNVKIIDAARETNYKSVITREAKNALLIGITSLTTEVKNAIEISDFIKTACDAPIIWGGWHPTLFSTQTCSDKSVDFVCIDEGEYTLLKLAEALESGDSFEDIDGLVYKNNGQVNVNPKKEFVDLEKLPPVNYGLIDIAEYLSPRSQQGLTHVKNERQLPYQSSRGCPHRCSFCINTVTGNRAWRMKSARKTVDELEILVEKHSINSIDFVDDNFFVNLKRVEEICKEMIARKLDIKWYAECRADYVDRFKPEFLDLCQRSGLSGLFIGAESGSQRVLNLLSKDLSVEQILSSAKILSKYNIEPAYSFILGVPSETDDETRMTVRVAENTRKICRKAVYRFSIFTPYPKCEITDRLLAEGLVYEPRTLREWTENDVRNMFSGRGSGKRWNRNPRLLENTLYFAGTAYNVYSDQKIADYIKRFEVHRCLNILFIYMARLRMKTGFYYVPIDKYVRTLSRVFQF